MILTRTPFRVSLFGGGTDYPQWYLQHGGAVIGGAINKYCYISLRALPPFFEHKHRIVYSKVEQANAIAEIQHPAVRAVLDEMKVMEGMEIHHDGDLPARSGLGSSSSFTVGLLNAVQAFRGRMATKRELALEAIRIEQEVIAENVGSQDQVWAAYGGLNRIDFRPDGSIDVTPLIIPPERRNLLEGSLMLFFTGLSRYASTIAKDKIANLGQREVELKTMRAMVDEAQGILCGSTRSIDDLGRLLHESWLLKRGLASSISNSSIDHIYQAALEAGALGGKLLGAGGGGFFLVFAPPERQAAVREKLKHLVHVPFQFEAGGSKVVVYEPNGFGSPE